MLLHRCAHCFQAAARDGAASGSAAARLFTVDLHCHALSPEVEQLLGSHPRRRAEPEALARMFGADSVEYNARVMLPAIAPKLTQPDVRLADMDAMGVDMQVVSPSPNQYYYWAEQALAHDIVRIQNEGLEALCKEHPGRLRALGAVALQHPELAARQLRDAVEKLGLYGVQISTNVEGGELSDPKFEPFWAEAARLQCVVFIHPMGPWGFDRLGRWYMANVIGQPLETTIALSHLIFSGLLDRHPTLRLLAAHGGGYMPFYIGRFEKAWQVRPEARRMRHPPRHYLKRIWYDTVVYEPMAVRTLIDEVGLSQVVLGTDYPYDMGCDQLAAMLERVPGLDARGRADVAGANALKLLARESQS
jgi:aminocarboxymuconate-semialdehyde decarboxylase